MRAMGAMRPTTASLRRGSAADAVVALLVLVLLVVMASSARDLVLGYPYGVDLEIPLRAAERWVAGGDPYPAAAFHAPNGPGLPFLYPPFVLPIIAPLTVLPRAVVMTIWTAILTGAGYAAGRRLGLGPVVAAIALTWPPFLEAIIGGNVQVLLFAAFVVLLYRDGRPVDPAASPRPAITDGLLGTFVGALKVSQVHTWAYLLRRRPAAALTGLAIFAAIAIVTLPLVGANTWLDW
ncbi:MAG: DUF2029 domain-containing protein, partial [Chloroflexota bacterium]